MKKIVFVLLMLASSVYAQKITATSWLVADGNGNVLDRQNSDQMRSIASITKLMTAVVILDAQQALDEKIGNFTRLELMQMMLIKSDNNAAEILCSNYPGGRNLCIIAMNNKAKELDLTNTYFEDPTGLGIKNVSTAEELVKLVLLTGTYPDIVQISTTPSASVKVKKTITSFYNTNPLVSTRNFIISKTGYIRASGGCIVMMLDTELGRRIVVLLNSKNTKTRIPEANLLARRF